MEARVYYKIDGYDNFPTIHLSDMEVFESMLEKYQPAYILVANDSVTEKGEKDLIGRNKTVNKAVTRLAFEHNGVLYSVNSRNFTSIKDYKDAGLKGFDNGLDYYAASEGNFIDKEEYDNCKAAGFDDRVEYLKAQNLDFEGGIEKLKEANENGKISDGNFSKIKDLTTDAQVYNFAKNFGYDSYEEFENALSSGFVKSDATDYREAVEKGFDSSDAFYSAKKGSFSGLDEYQQANVLGIEDQREFQKYNELSNLREQYGFRSMEQAHLFDELALLGEGKKTINNPNMGYAQRSSKKHYLWPQRRARLVRPSNCSNFWWRSKSSRLVFYFL